MRKFTRGFCTALLLAAPVALADIHMKHGMTHDMKGVAVIDAWARASVGKNGAAFITITNHGKAGDRLLAVESEIADRVELHTHLRDGNIMRMRRVRDIGLDAGKTMSMKPGGHHVMLMGLKRKLTEGESFPLTLVFAKAGKIETTVSIKSIGAMKSGHGAHDGHGKMKH